MTVAVRVFMSHVTPREGKWILKDSRASPRLESRERPSEDIPRVWSEGRKVSIHQGSAFSGLQVALKSKI